MDETTLRDDLLIVFEYAHHKDDWVNPVAEALDGVTVDEALWEPGPDSPGIWRIVLHMAVWNEHMVHRMQGAPPGKPPEGAWPDLPELCDESSWRTTRERLDRSIDALRERIATTPVPELLAPNPRGSFLGDALCRYIHNAYHLGQITKLRECWSNR